MRLRIPSLKYFRLFNNQPRRLVSVLLFETYIAIVLIFFAIGYFWIFQKYNAFKKESRQVQRDYIETQKRTVKKETIDAIDFINYKRLQTDKALKDLLRNRTNEAISVAQNIYDQYKNKKRPEEVKELIVEALRPIRFNNGRGYFFIENMAGIEILYPIAKQNEGKEFYGLQDDMGNFVVRDEINMVKTYGEGFCYGFWKKPGSENASHQKISFVKLFDPYKWIIGTGEYIDDYTRDVQQEVLDRISKIRFGKEGYIFINSYNGDALLTDGNLVTIQKNLWELEDPNGVKVIQEERNAVKNPNGDFIYYSWRKLTSTEIVKKISYVKGIPEWQWMVGAGIYTDEINSTLQKYKSNLIKTIRKDILIILTILFAILFLLTVFSFYITKRASANINSFIDFFKKASHDYSMIDESKIYFSEFKSLANSANNMIREMKKTELLKAEEEIYFERLFESAPEAIVLIGNNGNIIRVNNEFTRLFGFTKTEIHYKNVDDFIVPPELKDEAKNNAQHAETGAIVSIESIRICKDGRRIFVSILATPILKNNNKIGTYIIYRDITDKKQAEQSLNDAKQKAEESDRLKGAFLTNMSHEIRTPMNAIIGFSTLIKNPALNSDDRNEYINIIEKSGYNLLTIIDDIIDVSKLEAEELSINKINTNINTLIDDLLIHYEDIKKLKEIKNIRFYTKKAVPSKDFIIYTDPKRFRQIFTYLLDNALKFTEQGKIEFGYYTQDSQLICFVKDTGIGIPEEKKLLVVKPFRQVEESDSRKYGGTGLGLSISKKLVENLGGKFWFDSETGVGSSFYFSIPQEKLAKQPSEPENNYDPLLKSNWKNKKILIAEDATTNFRFLEAVLERTNAKLAWAKDGQEVLSFVENNPDFDLILMDIQMPIMNGHDALRQLRKQGVKIPVIAQTAYAMEADKQEIIDLGYDDYIIKPIEINLLLKKISNILDK